MSKKEDSYYIDQIDAYLKGELSSIDKIQFDKALSVNPSLKDKIESHINARSLIRQQGELELKSKFLNALANEEDLPPKPKSSLIKWILLALLLLIVVFISYTLYNKSEDPKTSSIQFALLSVQDPSYSLLRGQSDTTNLTIWKSAVQSFVEKDYTKTILSLDSLSSNSKFKENHIGKYALMQGVSYLKLQEYENAVRALSNITKTNPYHDQAEWYLALTAYYNKNISEAKSRLKVISQNPRHYKREEAKKYLKSLQ